MRIEEWKCQCERCWERFRKKYGSERKCGRQGFRDCESEVNEEKSESENEQSDSENERLIRSFVREYEMECWRKQ